MSLVYIEQTPASTQFGDTYYAKGVRADAIAEKQYVFIEGTQLIHRLQQCTKPTYHVLELGFGTALNVLLTAHYFLEQSHVQRLHIVSIEGYPLSTQDLADLFAQGSVNASLEHELLMQYQPILGVQHICLGQGRIQLTLLKMLAEHATVYLQQHAVQQGLFNSVYLDGFAPNKNPDMWQANLIHAIAPLCADAAQLATYTAAGHVRRLLQQSGFVVHKRKGFRHKREMLVAEKHNTV